MHFPVDRTQKHQQSATRVYIQKHFSNPETRGGFERVNVGKERLLTIRETIREGTYYLLLPAVAHLNFIRAPPNGATLMTIR